MMKLFFFLEKKVINLNMVKEIHYPASQSFLISGDCLVTKENKVHIQ